MEEKPIRWKNLYIGLIAALLVQLVLFSWLMTAYA